MLSNQLSIANENHYQLQFRMTDQSGTPKGCHTYGTRLNYN